MSDFAWGKKDTEFFYALTPERILDAVEASTGLRCTGRTMALNSMENRVYEIEIELDEKPKNPADAFVIAKFYRPGRWSLEQIQAEHTFLSDLVEVEIPACAATPFTDGKTIHKLEDAGIYYTVFPKIRGRSPYELTNTDLQIVGRLLGRMHNCGAAGKADSRVKLDPQTYGIQNLKYLIDSKSIPMEIESAYKTMVESIVQITEPWFNQVTYQRIHGDCHLGNLLQGAQNEFFWVDFDDMVRGPCVQDLWLLIPGRDEYSQAQWRVLLEAYETMRPFNHFEKKLVEPLRALRFVHFSAWISKRFKDPAFQRAFSHYGTMQYWQEQLQDLREQLALIQESQMY
jgi:Ser/Thr protein kinase RdoA (MazF antagonist)